MRYFFTSDTHFGHANVIKYSKRPYQTADEMDEQLIVSWNSVVSPQDIVFHLGDVGFTSPDRLAWILGRLNGNKHLIYGNHDQTIKRNKFLQQMFSFCRDYYELKVKLSTGADQLIVLQHYPLLTWNKGHYGSWMLHGHCHGQVLHPGGGRIVDVGVDPMGYKPVSLDELEPMMINRSFTKHHTD